MLGRYVRICQYSYLTHVSEEVSGGSVCFTWIPKVVNNLLAQGIQCVPKNIAPSCHLNKLVYLEHVRALRDVQLVVRLQGSGVNMNQ